MESKTYLYHYAAKQFAKLKTKNKQNGLKPQISESPYRIGHYADHVSFFTEPPPLEILGTIFGKDHPVWYPGSVLFEHRIDVDKIRSFIAEFVETPIATKLYYDPKYDDYTGDRWLKLLFDAQKEAGEIFDTKVQRNNNHDFKKKCRSFDGMVRLYYTKLPARPNFSDICKKYAPSVPHLMLYPDDGEIPVEHSRLVKVGAEAIALPESTLDKWS